MLQSAQSSMNQPYAWNDGGDSVGLVNSPICRIEVARSPASCRTLLDFGVENGFGFVRQPGRVHFHNAVLHAIERFLLQNQGAYANIRYTRRNADTHSSIAQ